ncbi:Hypothetical Protein FCC1311_029152 [Hondaea fermentalgiana]|uniref:WW domain-containing protein n=1 Tax=Hondaea fermentalgiana TaxID=2315210 RepID=A0A2R5GFP6_9STRA|nr:Hypothetical Protein FCC1311_029152 [Hondaea fermentalgiana]|eukprot:GBG26694.1 Hypothetical Protein FCC1311_029152 [Hondaea fermentalgiana]
MVMKMSKAVLAIVAALATSAAVVEGAVADLEPSTFATNRTGTPIVMYALTQSQCSASDFVDAVDDDLLGGMNYSTAFTEEERCPSYTDSVTSFEFPYPAHNGVQFPGTRWTSGGRTNEVALQSTVVATDLETPFASADGFTLEFWVIPTSAIETADTKYILFEIGKDPASLTKTPGDAYVWEVDDDTASSDFVLQVAYQLTSGTPTFLFDYMWGDEYIVTGDTFSTFRITVTDASTDTMTTATDRFRPFFADFTDCYLRIGSSPETLSSATTYSGTNAWPGSILFFAISSPSLVSDDGTTTDTSDVVTNYNAGLPNSGPVMMTQTGSTNVTVEVDEDAALVDSEINPTTIVFDFDTEWFGAAAPNFVLTGSDTGTGQLGAIVKIDGAAVNLTADLPMEVTSDITYQAEENKYGLGTSLTFSATDSYLTAPNEASVNVVVNPENDDPEALTTSTWSDYTSQSTYSEIVLRARDIDCLSSTGSDATSANALLTSCNEFGRSKTFTVYTPGDEASSSSPLGRLYEPDETDGCTGGLEQAITDNRDISVSSAYTAVVEGSNTQTLTLCFEACLGTVEDDPSLENPCPSELNNASDLGDAIFSFTVTDAFGAVSNEVNVSTAVTSVLDANVGDNLIVIEDNVTMVQLNGTDNYCEQDPVPSDCTDRTMTFMLTEQIPESQGQLFLDEDMTVPLDINVEFNGTFYILPAENYYSVDSWPLCSSGTAYSMSLCPDGNLAIGDTEYPFTCTGPFCTGAYASRYARFTTSDLNQVVMGNATSELCTSTGCPIKITYKILIDSEGLESTAASGASIYVSNVNDAPEIVIPVSSMTNLVRNTYYDFADDNGAVIQLTDSDANSRIIDAIVQVRNTEGRISISEELVMDSDRFVYKRGGGVISSGASDVRMTGTLSEINRVLAVLRYRSTSADISDAITITVFDTTRGVDLTNGYTAYDGVIYNEVIGTVSISVQAESDDDGVQLTLPTLAIYGMIGGGALCCIGFCVGLVCAIASCAQRGNRTARWILHHVLCSTIKSTGDDLGEEMQSAAKFTEAAVHAEHARLTKVVWCAKFMHCMCPCCVKFSPENSAVPDEEQMMVAVTDRLRHERASQHIPKDTREKSVRLVVPPEDLFNWERHMHHDEETGRDIPYYFNSKTNQSSWHRPKVRDHADPPDEV